MDKEILFYVQKHEFEYKNASPELEGVQLASAGRLMKKVTASKTLVRIEVTRG